MTRYEPPVTDSSLQRASLAVLNTSDCPTASVRCTAVRRLAVATPVSLFAFTCSVTGRTLSHAQPLAGSVMFSCVVVAAVTVA